MTAAERRAVAAKGDAVPLMPVLQTYRDVALALTRAVVDCPLGYHDGRLLAPTNTTNADVVAWLQRLARISEAVEGIDAATPPPEAIGHAESLTEALEPPETPHPHDATCSTCGARLLFSARRRGDGLCGPCHAKATGAQTLADRCRAAGLEPSLVLEILRSPEAREALGLTPDPRIGKLCRPGEWNGGIARVVGVESNGRYLLVREDNWSAACEDARVRVSDVQWVDEAPEPPASVEVDVPAKLAPPGSVGIAFAAYLASPEGRAAIAECMRRPPVRMADGTWREPTPGRDAKPGDVVRFLASNRGGEVYRIGADGNLWLRAEGGGYETAAADDVEVAVPAEHVRTRPQPIAKARQESGP